MEQTNRTEEKEQLKMLKFFKENEESRLYQILEGYYIRTAKLEDGPAWCKCCLNGCLGVEECSVDLFKERMLDDPSVSLDNIFLICDSEGKIAGTATARLPIAKHYPDAGILHMVAVADEYKGKGLAGPVCEAAVNRVKSMGYDKCFLTTDDHRIPAIKIYIKLGFLPIINSDEMRARWENILKQININSIDALDENLSPIAPVETK